MSHRLKKATAATVGHHVIHKCDMINYKIPVPSHPIPTINQYPPLPPPVNQSINQSINQSTTTTNNWSPHNQSVNQSIIIICSFIYIMILDRFLSIKIFLFLSIIDQLCLIHHCIFHLFTNFFPLNDTHIHLFMLD